jgi:hypothetical protein
MGYLLKEMYSYESCYLSWIFRLVRQLTDVSEERDIFVFIVEK